MVHSLQILRGSINKYSSGESNDNVQFVISTDFVLTQCHCFCMNVFMRQAEYLCETSF